MRKFIMDGHFLLPNSTIAIMVYMADPTDFSLGLTGCVRIWTEGWDFD